MTESRSPVAAVVVGILSLACAGLGAGGGYWWRGQQANTELAAVQSKLTPLEADQEKLHTVMKVTVTETPEAAVAQVEKWKQDVDNLQRALDSEKAWRTFAEDSAQTYEKRAGELERSLMESRVQRETLAVTPPPPRNMGRQEVSLLKKNADATAPSSETSQSVPQTVSRYRLPGFLPPNTEVVKVIPFQGGQIIVTK